MIQAAGPELARPRSPAASGTGAREEFETSGCRPLLVFEHLTEQFAHALPGGGQCRTAEGRDAIDTAATAGILHHARFQIPVPLHAVQDRIERAGAQFVPVMTELVDHPLAED